MSLVQIKYSDLISDNVELIKIFQAFSDDGLGALLITDIPDFKSMKMKLLTLSKQFGELPESIQQKYETPNTFYSFGWSRGKEKLQNGKYDTAKGSFYANPVYDEPTKDKKLIEKYPANYSKNIWPTEHIPTFESHFKFLGGFMVNIGYLVLKQCDKYLSSIIKDYPENNLYNIIKNSKTYKARLLHYYEQEEKQNKILDSSCGWHLDHGGLTILTKAVYLDEYYNEIEEQEDSGLYIKDRNSNIHHSKIPENAVLCQIGEILQILSGGYFQATPHCVRSSKLKGVTRETFPVFIDCDVEHSIKLPKWSKKNVLETKGMNGLNIRTLENRYKNCEKYYQFVHNTYSSYYN